IYVVSYGPAKLFVDFEIKTALNIIVAQIIYLFISYMLCTLMYNKGVKRINVNGG
ncbi:MAG TPA: ABC transporter permease, partial [Clostridiales bacterium]|nr:ABC transporter permease [Clostridiales bacterium]